MTKSKSESSLPGPRPALRLPKVKRALDDHNVHKKRPRKRDLRLPPPGGKHQLA